MSLVLHGVISALFEPLCTTLHTIGHSHTVFCRFNPSAVLRGMPAFGSAVTYKLMSICRAALQTGRHVLRYGLANTVIWPQDAYAVPENETFLSQNLKDLGYQTAAFGKWHLGLYKKWALPQQRG